VDVFRDLYEELTDHGIAFGIGRVEMQEVY